LGGRKKAELIHEVLVDCTRLEEHLRRMQELALELVGLLIRLTNLLATVGSLDGETWKLAKQVILFDWPELVVVGEENVLVRRSADVEEVARYIPDHPEMEVHQLEGLSGLAIAGDQDAILSTAVSHDEKVEKAVRGSINLSCR